MPSNFFNISSAFSSSVINSESTNSISTFTLFANPPCFKLSTTDKYESSKLIYLPTIAILTAFSGIFFIFSIIFSHFSFLGALFFKLRCSQTTLANPSLSSINGTSYNTSTVEFCITFSFLTLQNNAILSFIPSGIPIPDLQTNTSGFIPYD